MNKPNYMLPVLACLLSPLFAGSSIADELKDKNSRNCIQTRSLKSTAVVDDLNVLFIKKGNIVYHNRLPQQCNGLSRTKQFSYTTLSGSLCSFDNIRVVNIHGVEGKTCRLGTFYEISTEELRSLVERSRRPTGPDSQPPDEKALVIEPEEVTAESDNAKSSTPE